VGGIHTAASTNNTSYAARITRATFESAKKELEHQTGLLSIFSEASLRLDEPMEKEPHKRSPFQYEKLDGISYIGSLTTASNVPKNSNLVETEFTQVSEQLTGCSHLDEHGEPHYAGPTMRPFTRDGEYFGPYNKWLQKVAVTKQTLDPTVLRAVTDVLTAHITTALRRKGITEITPVTLEVAQNGHPEDFFMRSMSMSTSAGFGWKGNKRANAVPLPLSFKEDAYMPTHEVKDQVIEVITDYVKDRNYGPILYAQLKDEPRPLEKVRQAKTRVFAMAPYHMTLVQRMFLMPFYSLMVEHGDVFCSAVGINMHSEDVDDFVNNLRNFSDHLMEGDYGGFDTSMPFDIGLVANTVVYRVLENFGYNKEALQCVQGLLSDNMMPLIKMCQDLFYAPSFQPSGKYATAEDNSLRGLVMLMYAWAVKCTPLGKGHKLNTTTGYKLDDFFQHVRPVVYGDDMLAAVKSGALRHYNNLTYQAFCKQVYGLDFTNAEKTSEMSKSLTINTASFLKRTFYYRQDLGHWVARLDRKSIMKTICYRLPSKSVTSTEQMIDASVSALRELFFWHPQKDYEQLRFTWLKVVSDILDVDPSGLASRYPNFEQIRDRVYPVSSDVLR
jgi:hypothetical protein